MRLDALGYERQFIDHIAPVWRALPADVRGTFLVEPSLVGYAESRGLVVEGRPRLDVARGEMIAPPASPIGPALVASYGDTKEARRFGYGPLAYIEHGIGQSYGDPRTPLSGSYSGGPDRDDTTLFLVPGPHPAERWRRRYPGARVEVVGSPRLADLPRRAPGPGPVVAFSFHWDAPLSLGGYAGTAVGDFQSELPAIAARWSVIGHAHPKTGWPERMQTMYRRFGIEFVADFEDVCRRADVYVCDNSSTIYEFAATGRPVVLLNARYWHRNGPEYGLRFWAASHVGQNVHSRADLAGAIARALEDRAPDRLMREDALRLVYGRRDDSAYRAATALVEWMDSAAAVAA